MAIGGPDLGGWAALAEPELSLFSVKVVLVKYAITPPLTINVTGVPGIVTRKWRTLKPLGSGTYGRMAGLAPGSDGRGYDIMCQYTGSGRYVNVTHP